MILSTLSCNCDLLERQCLSCEDLTVLEDCLAITKYEVNGAVDMTITIELTQGMCIEGILITFNATSKEGGSVGINTKGHGLVVLWARSISKCYVPSDKTRPRNSYKVVT
ncbi:hypothetical protein M5K25_010561 [Dendrobium thyrsiflorum]|uniref:Uncharacterized protein n=1 Tax=Dendrobium thyrsiflorum TaxID=117978 RepID=A0ABD0V7N8_DENTH